MSAAQLQLPRRPYAIRPCAARSLGARARAGGASPRRTFICRASRRDEPSEDLDGVMSGESFYAILGVPPTADQREIRLAYHALMRAHHPDLAAASAPAGADADLSTEVCALLNAIYATLSDAAARELYDAIAGFSPDAVSPFEDASFPADQVFVDEVSCIGCGKCVRSCPEAFFIEDSKYGRARWVPGADAAQLAEGVDIAIEVCPVDCIHWVTSPQLAVLEAALAKMARVEAFIMMRQSRAPGDVFREAQRAWDKRQARLAAAREQARGGGRGGAGVGGGWASFWGQHVETRGGAGPAGVGAGAGEGAGAGAGGGDRSRQRVADLAGAASRAVRRWRMQQQISAPQKALTD